MASSSWQTGKINERMKYLLESGEDSDIEFLVRINNHSGEKKLFKVHKLILKNASAIFASQIHFEESLDEVINEPIEIKDNGIFASSFNAMLHFIYTDDSSLINNNNIVGVYLAAKKYLLNSLVQKCIGLVKPDYREQFKSSDYFGRKSHLKSKSSNQTMLDEENVFDMLQAAKDHKIEMKKNTNQMTIFDEEETLIRACWKFIDEKIGNFGIGVTLLSQEEMAELLGRDTLKCEEIKLFNHLNNWAAKQCQNEGIIEPTGKQKRGKVGTLLNSIRFPLIPPMEFIRKILPTDILSKDQISAMLLHYTSDLNVIPNPMPFSIKPRAIPPQGFNKLVDYDTGNFNH